MMSKAIVALVVALVCIASVQSTKVPAFCAHVSQKCKAKAAISIFVSGPGNCSGSAKAACKSIARRTEACIKRVDAKFFSRKCFDLDVSAYANCYTAAVAAVFTNAAASMSCTGKKAYGCAWSKAEGKAFACSYALSIIDMVIRIGGHKASCEAKIGALAEVFARAASKSAADVCAYKGHENDFDRDFAVAIDAAVARAFASCWVRCDGTEASAEVEGEAEVIPKQIVFGGGDGGSASVGDGH